MELQFTRHASARMRERGISEEHIAFALANYHSCWLTLTTSYLTRGFVPGHGELKVWIDLLPNKLIPITVISTAWSERK